MIISFYAAILALVYIGLAVRVIIKRNQLKIATGDGGDALLCRDIRVHGNFAEYVPFALILLILAEMQGMPFWAMHALGLSLLVARLWHIYALCANLLPFRVAGVMLTFAVMAVPAIYLLVQAAAML